MYGMDLRQPGCRSEQEYLWHTNRMLDGPMDRSPQKC
jgi:hypothetical protein